MNSKVSWRYEPPLLDILIGWFLFQKLTVSDRKFVEPTKKLMEPNVSVNKDMLQLIFADRPSLRVHVIEQINRIGIQPFLQRPHREINAVQRHALIGAGAAHCCQHCNDPKEPDNASAIYTNSCVESLYTFRNIPNFLQISE
jgi:hypothetical protein